MDIIRDEKQGAKVKLERISTLPPRKADREEAKAEFDALGEELFDLQDLLWGARMNSVLIVLQGRDTAGKDGTIKHVVGSLNPRGVSVTSFGVPTPRSWSTTSSGASTARPLARASSPSSTARTTRTCSWRA